MDLIYTDTEFNDIDMLDYMSLDYDCADEKDFQMQIDSDLNVMSRGCLWYIENTEFGGIVEKIDSSTENGTVTYKGLNTRGILAKKIIIPGKTRRTVEGNATNIIQELIIECGLTDIFSVDADDYDIPSFTFDWYCTLYDGLIAMLDSINCKLTIMHSGIDRKFHLTCSLKNDLTEELQFSVNDTFNFSIADDGEGINHLICLGPGDTSDQYIIHIFTNELGYIQPYTRTDHPIYDSDYILDQSQKVIVDTSERVEVLDCSGASGTDNYVLLNSRPSDWSKNSELYYTRTYNEEDEDFSYESVKNESTDVYNYINSKPPTWDSSYGDFFILENGSYTAAKGTDEDIWKRITTKPADWGTNYGNYYYDFNNGLTVERKQVDGTSWTSYEKQQSIPTDWSDNYSSYYIKKKKKDGKKVVKKNGKVVYEYVSVEGTGKKKNKAPKWNKNTYYTSVSKTSQPKWNTAYAYYLVIGQRTIPPTFVTNKFYKKDTVEYAPTFLSNTFYKKITDHFAQIIESAKSWIDENKITQTASVTLTDYVCDIGDIVGGSDPISKISIREEVTNIIYKIENGSESYEYVIGGR